MKLPYRYRGIALLALLVAVLPWLAWRYAFADTLGVWFECRRVAAQLAQTPPEVSVAVGEGPKGRELVLSGELLNQIGVTNTGSAVRVAGYEPLVTERRDHLSVHTVQLTLTGRYNDLLRVVERVERTPCRLRSLGWKCSADPATRQRQLAVTLHIQQIVTKD